LSRRQRAEKIAYVATLAQVMRQLKNIAEKNCEIFNELNFSQQNHGLCHSCQNLSPSVATIARRRRGNFQKKSHHHRKQKIARAGAA